MERILFITFLLRFVKLDFVQSEICVNRLLKVELEAS